MHTTIVKTTQENIIAGADNNKHFCKGHAVFIKEVIIYILANYIFLNPVIFASCGVILTTYKINKEQ